MVNDWRVARTYFGNLEGILRETEKQGYRILLIAQLDPLKTKQQFEVAVISKRSDDDSAGSKSSNSGSANSGSSNSLSVPISPQFGSFTSDRDSVFADQ